MMLFHLPHVYFIFIFLFRPYKRYLSKHRNYQRLWGDILNRNFLQGVRVFLRGEKRVKKRLINRYKNVEDEEGRQE